MSTRTSHAAGAATRCANLPLGRQVNFIEPLFREADEQVERTGSVDDVWIDAAAGTLVLVILNGHTADLTAMERSLNRLDTKILIGMADEADRDRMLDQLRLLRRLSQLGGDAVAPREIAAKIEPDTNAARLLSLLATSDDEVFSDAIVKELGLHATQLSHLYKRLGPDVLERRKYGRRVSWSLTSTGEAIAAQLRERVLNPPSEARVTAASPEEFEDAVYREADAIEVDRPAGGDALYLRATYSRVSGDDLYEDTPLPFVVFPSSNDHAAYLRGDFACRLADYVSAGPTSDRAAGLKLAWNSITAVDPADPTDDADDLVRSC